MKFVSITVPNDDRWYFAEIITGAAAALEAAGIDAKTRVIPPSPTASAQAGAAISSDFTDPDAAGAIAAGFKHAPDQRDRVLAWQRPVVIIGGSVFGFPAVMIDDIHAARTATEHLIKLGHRRIAHITGPLDQQLDFHVDGRRAKGYRVVMDQAGFPAVVIESEFRPDAIYQHARTLLESPKPPTAIFATSDEYAFPVIAAIRDTGLGLGLDVSVIAIDDHPDATTADLTTIRQRPAEMGATAAEMILAGLNYGPDPSKSRLHSTVLIQRGSTNPPRHR